jgi:chorismate mutase
MGEGEGPATGLEGLRAEIAGVDGRIMELMRERVRLAEMVGEAKLASGMEVKDRGVEERIVGRYRRFAEDNGMDPDVAEEVCRALIRESVAAQESMR